MYLIRANYENILKLRNCFKIFKQNNYKISFSKNLIKYTNKKDVIELKKRINNFLTVLTRDCKNFNPTLFYNNFKSSYFDISEIGFKEVGYIEKHNNSILLKLNSFELSNHELSHLSSTPIKGFYFKPFDEGYTQLIAERYFNENVGTLYQYQVLICKKLEEICGKDYLEQEYFKGNLMNAINVQLLKYGSEELIFKMSEYNKNLFETENYIDEENLDYQNYFGYIESLIENINIILDALYKEKLKQNKEFNSRIK